MKLPKMEPHINIIRDYNGKDEKDIRIQNNYHNAYGKGNLK